MTTKRMVGFVAAHFFLLAVVPMAASGPGTTGASALAPAATADWQRAEDYFLEAFKSLNIIAVGEGSHGLVNSHDLFVKLLSNREIRKTVNVIIVEFCSAAYQEVLDRYLAGEKVDFDELRKAWQETGQSIEGIWDKPVYYRLLQTIREANAGLPKERRIRVLAGDPALDWTTIRSREDYFGSSYMKQRDTWPARLAIEQGIEKNRKVLIIYGGRHLSKIGDPDKRSMGLSTIIEREKPGSIRVIEVFDSRRMTIDEIAQPVTPEVILDLHQSPIGDRDANQYAWEFGTNRATDKEWLKRYDGFKIRDNVDAFLYVGDHKDWKGAPFTKDAFKDDRYWKELNRRSQAVWGQPLDESMRK